MSARRTTARERRYRLVAALRLVAGLAWLTCAVAFFRVPLGQALGPVAWNVGLPRLFRPADPGFMLRVTSDPPGARLWVDGVDRGQVPLFVNVVCTEGEKVLVQVVKDGLAPWEREIGCREDETLLVRARLGQ